METSAAFEFNPMWHGDHWQNLLASPMDARRYVIEDWSLPALEDWTDAEGTVGVH
jgi:predicted alpha/beta hydrolase family esterase